MTWRAVNAGPISIRHESPAAPGAPVTKWPISSNSASAQAIGLNSRSFCRCKMPSSAHALLNPCRKRGRERNAVPDSLAPPRLRPAVKSVNSAGFCSASWPSIESGALTSGGVWRAAERAPTFLARGGSGPRGCRSCRTAISVSCSSDRGADRTRPGVGAGTDAAGPAVSDSA